MKVDFINDTFDPAKRFVRVLMQQGRVILAEDWNEAYAILLHYMQTLAVDLIGPHGGPGDAFKIGSIEHTTYDFSISPGHYYVSGILCDNSGKPPADYVAYTAQEDYPRPLPEYLPEEEKLAADNSYLIYLHVWERSITSDQDESIREVALGGPDTAARSRVVWQAKILQLDLSADRVIIDGEELSITQLEETADKSLKLRGYDELLKAKLKEFGKLSQGKLAARVQPSQKADDPCIVPPEARYRGIENQLYRVEIHEPGTAIQQGAAGYEQDGGTNGNSATFKWSQDNGAIVFPIERFDHAPDGDHATVKVEHLGQDSSRTLEEGNWVEFVNDYIEKHGLAGPLFEVKRVDPVDLTVTLSSPEGPASPPPSHGEAYGTHPLLRRWDSPGAVNVTVSDTHDRGWIHLKDGIEIKFYEGEADSSFMNGQYWLIQARATTGDIQWPQEGHPPTPKALAPRGIAHHYAPLSRITLNSSGALTSDPVDYRRTFKPLSEHS